MRSPSMQITRTSIFTGITRTKELPITIHQWYEYVNGVCAQDAFPQLSDSQREFILTGITDSEWDQYMSDEEEDNDEEESIYDFFDDSAF